MKTKKKIAARKKAFQQFKDELPAHDQNATARVGPKSFDVDKARWLVSQRGHSIANRQEIESLAGGLGLTIIQKHDHDATYILIYFRVDHEKAMNMPDEWAENPIILMFYRNENGTIGLFPLDGLHRIYRAFHNGTHEINYHLLNEVEADYIEIEIDNE